MTRATSADRWRDALACWAIPDDILAAAPADPHTFSVSRFSDLAAQARRRPLSVTHQRAAERLPPGGSLLDVGCGGGAGGLPLADRAGLLIGADQSAGMLAAFADSARQCGVAVQTVEGAWPEAAERTPHADVVVCLHVIYNVPELARFARALTTHARRRVVLEFPTRHPLDWLRPYWRAVHGIDRPLGPTSDDALAVFADLGFEPEHQQWPRPVSLHADDVDRQVAFVCQRLAVGADRRSEVADLIAHHGVPAERTVVTAWWDVADDAPDGS